MVPRESEDNAYAKFWVDKQRALWYVTVFWGMVNIAPIPDYLMDTISIRRWYICLERRPLRLTVSLRNGVHDYLIKMAEFPAKTERRKRKTYCPIVVMNFLKRFCLKNTYSLCPQTAPKNRPKF